MKRKNNLRIMATIIMFMVLSVNTITARSLTDYDKPNEREDITMITDLKGKDLAWEIKNSLGVYASQQYHSQDQIGYKVRNVDTGANVYEVNVSKKSWMTGDWVMEPESTNSSYLIAPRDWGQLALDIVVDHLAPYWFKHPTMLYTYFKDALDTFDVDPSQYDSNEEIGQAILNYMTNLTLLEPDAWDYYYEDGLADETAHRLLKEFLTFETENIWFDSRFMVIQRISIDLDADNFDHLVYTKEEGILISRETSIKIENGTDINIPLRGSLVVELVDYSGVDLSVSIWHYVIWVAVGLVSVVVVIVAIGILINRRQRRLANLDY